ncbi:MAG: undecaprenyl-diphosphate phosphatase [Roseiflexaceae bacterium]|nr:undecaprenyl-diphosphate phosphatase [Roseiflexaceae bacterium]
MGYSQAVVMGIVQGLGEFLPISSSAHLILVPWLFGWEGNGLDSLTFDVALHIGTLIAVVAYFWRDWLSLVQAAPGLARWSFGATRGRPGALGSSERLLLFVVMATIPGGILGLLLKDYVDGVFRSPLLIACTLPILGVLLYVADRYRPQQRTIDQLTWKDALAIGVAQGCALIPGISRSGATMTTARFMQLDRNAAARFSFLLSAPITAAAVLSEARNILAISPAEVGTFVVGVLVSGAVGALAIHFLLDYIRRAGFGIFAGYRVALALVIVAVWFAR